MTNNISEELYSPHSDTALADVVREDEQTIREDEDELAEIEYEEDVEKPEVGGDIDGDFIGQFSGEEE